MNHDEIARRTVTRNGNDYLVRVVVDDEQSIDYDLPNEITDNYGKTWQHVGVIVTSALTADIETSLWSVEYGQFTDDGPTIDIDTLITDDYMTVTDKAGTTRTWTLVDTLITECLEELRKMRDALNAMDLEDL